MAYSDRAKSLSGYLEGRFKDFTVREKGGNLEVRINTDGLNANSEEFKYIKYRGGYIRSYYERNILVILFEQ